MSLIDRIDAMLEANPYHDRGGEFVSKAKVRAGTYSLGRKRHIVRRDGDKLKKAVADTGCGRDARRDDGDVRCWDNEVKDDTE